MQLDKAMRHVARQGVAISACSIITTTCGIIVDLTQAVLYHHSVWQPSTNPSETIAIRAISFIVPGYSQRKLVDLLKPDDNFSDVIVLVINSSYINEDESDMNNDTNKDEHRVSHFASAGLRCLVNTLSPLGQPDRTSLEDEMMPELSDSVYNGSGGLPKGVGVLLCVQGPSIG